EEGVRRFRPGYGFQIAFVNSGVDDHVQFGFYNVDFAFVDGLNGVLIYVYADDVFLAGGEYGGCGEADVAEAYYGDGLVAHSCSPLKTEIIWPRNPLKKEKMKKEKIF